MTPDVAERLERWLAALVSTPGLTAVSDVAEAWRVHVDGSLAGLAEVARLPGPVVDVGSGGGSPGIPLAAHLPRRRVVLLEASRRKCAFLDRVAGGFPNVEVVCGRAEAHVLDVYGVAVARALAPPPVALEWCLPLVRAGGAVVLYVSVSASLDELSRVASAIGGGEAKRRGEVVVVPKLRPTPPGFPRRVGVARKRPLGRSGRPPA